MKLSAKETALRIERAVRSGGGPLAAWYARGQPAGEGIP